MKKTNIISAVLLSALLCFCAMSSACGGSDDAQPAPGSPSGDAAVADVAADALLDAALAEYSDEEKPSKSNYYRSGAAEDAEGYLDPDYAGLLFLDEFGADTGVFTRLDSYAMFVPTGKDAFEIDVLKLSDESDADEAEALLKSRFDRKDNGEVQTYNPEQLPILEGVQYYRKGKYVIMICTPDNAKAVAAIENLLNG